MYVTLQRVTKNAPLQRKYINRKHDEMSKPKHLVMVGRQDELQELCDELLSRPREATVEAVFTPDEEHRFLPELTRPYSHSDVLSSLDGLRAPAAVCCSPSVMTAGEMAELFYACEERGIGFMLLPLHVASLRRRMTTARVGHVTMLSPAAQPLSRWWNRLAKRVLDILVSLAALLTFFPLVWVWKAIGVKRRHGGPVFLRQKRCGPDGHVFHQFTFNGPAHARFALMPQLLNVLGGQMSLVGPALRTAADIEEYFREADRYHVARWPRPGMTGWSRQQSHQGQTRPLTPLQHEVADDIWYVENWSFPLDLRILLHIIKK